MFDRNVIYNATELWLKRLSDAYLRFIKEEHDGIMSQFREMTGGNCYLVGGSIFGPGGMRPPRIEKLKPLPAQLLPLHVDWLKNCDRHGSEWTRVEQVLRTVIGRAQSVQDIRDMIPDHVLRFFPSDFSQVERQRPDLFAGDPSEEGYVQRRKEREVYWESKLLDLYEKVASTVDLYVSYCLL